MRTAVRTTAYYYYMGLLLLLLLSDSYYRPMMMMWVEGAWTSPCTTRVRRRSLAPPPQQPRVHALSSTSSSTQHSRGYGRILLGASATTGSSTLDDDHNDNNDNDNNNDNNNSTTTTTLLQQKQALTRQFLDIAGPALVQLAAEPLAGLVDTAYLGRLGPAVLGGAGVAVSAQYAVSKLYNDPLLRTSISLVASQDGQQQQEQSKETNNNNNNNNTALSMAVSSALLLAAVVGVVQMLVFALGGAGLIRHLMGLSSDNTNIMWHSAVSYLRVRAVGTPAATLWLVANGIFRGLGDTKTPLRYSLLFTLLNIVLDPLFIFGAGWGAAGAAAGTALAQYLALVPMLWALHGKVGIDVVGNVRQLSQSLRDYLRAGSLVFFRTLGKVWAYGVCARQAAALGAVAAAAYNLTFQLGFATTQICEAVAVAVQTLLAREMASRRKPALLRHLIDLSVRLGGGVAAVLALTTYMWRDWIARSLTTSTAVQAASKAIFPVVLVTQVFKGLAYPVNGIIMGGLDWWYSMAVMWLANAVCVGLVAWFGRGGAAVSLNQIWWALAAFMATQVVAGIARYESKTGVWRILAREEKKEPDKHEM